MGCKVVAEATSVGGRVAAGVKHEGDEVIAGK